jgi:hypothetical protein
VFLATARGLLVKKKSFSSEHRATDSSASTRMRTPISTEASTSFRVRMEESSECRGNRTRRSVIFKVNDEAPIINRTYSAIRRSSTDVASEYRPRFTLRVLDFGSRLMEEPISSTSRPLSEK